MADSRQAWDQVGRDFTGLGQHLRRHYEQKADAGQPAPEDRRKVEGALRQLTESLDRVLTALGDAIRDPEFGEQARKTTNSLNEALSSTFAEVSQRFRSKEQQRPPDGG